jgi:hypothetical protein
VELLLALPEFERPGVFERLVLLAGFEEGHGILRDKFGKLRKLVKLETA